MSLATVVDSVLQHLFAVKAAGQAGKAASEGTSAQQLILIAVGVGAALVFLLAFLWNGYKARRKAPVASEGRSDG